jgi:hypothetical protein
VLPNVVVIGAQKCGTTALYRQFAQHPECVVCPEVKELHFFVDEGPWPIGSWRRGVSWYEGMFPSARIVADVCPSYSAWPVYPGTAERAAATVPEALIVYLVRDPIDRIVSHRMHWRDRGYDSRPFDEAVLDPDPGNEYLAGSRYGTQLRRWLEHYPAERVMVLHQLQLAAGDHGVLWRKLGLSEPAATGSEQRNPSTNLTEPTLLDRLPGPARRVLPTRLRRRPLARPAVTAETERRLRDVLGDDISLLHSLSDVRLEGWHT